MLEIWKRQIYNLQLVNWKENYWEPILPGRVLSAQDFEWNHQFQGFDLEWSSKKENTSLHDFQNIEITSKSFFFFIFFSTQNMFFFTISSK